MPLAPLSAWQSSLKALPPAPPGPDSMKNFAYWYASQILLISPNTSVFVPTGFLFTFNVSVFENMLKLAVPTLDSKKANDVLANAWEAAIMASIVLVLPGSFKVPASPSNLFSVVALSIIDPASIQQGKQHLSTLPSAPNGTADNSKFPQIFREATLKLTMTVTGVNSVTPTPGPLIVQNVPFV